jgi:hypothetical protein
MGRGARTTATHTPAARASTHDLRAIQAIYETLKSTVDGKTDRELARASRRHWDRMKHDMATSADAPFEAYAQLTGIPVEQLRSRYAPQPDHP